MQIYAIQMSLFDERKFAADFAEFLAKRCLNGTSFSRISGIPQYKVSRILCARVKRFGSDHSKICRFMQKEESVFFAQNSTKDLAKYIAETFVVELEQARVLAQAVANMVSLIRRRQ